MNVIYHAAAEAEVVETARYYSSRAMGLGREFLDAVDAAVQDILTDPARFAPVSGDIRMYLMKRFPYGIYYRLNGPTVRILVVKHHRRRPGFGMDRT